MKKAIFYPIKADNPYVYQIQKILVSANYEVGNLTLRNLLSGAWQRALFVSHWYESRNLKYGALGTIKIFLLLFTLRFLGYRIIWFRHNHSVHHAQTRLQKFFNRSAIALFGLFSTVRICHGVVAARQYADTYVPHPKYEFPEGLLSQEASPTQAKGDRFIVFGQIKRYKKIEALLSSWPSDIGLLIAGVFDKEYKEDILALIRARSLDIELDDRFIDDAELAQLVINSKGVIHVNDGQTAIVSGTLIYSLSLGVPVYATRSKMLDEFSDKYVGINVVNQWGDLKDISVSGDTREQILQALDVVERESSLLDVLKNLE